MKSGPKWSEWTFEGVPRCNVCRIRRRIVDFFGRKALERGLNPYERRTEDAVTHESASTASAYSHKVLCNFAL